MVKILSPNDNAFLHDALQQASRITSAKISVVVRPHSSSYQEYALAFGLILGSIAAFALWAADIVQAFPELLCIQLGIIAFCDLAQVYSGIFTRLVPKKIQRHYAGQEAMREYHIKHTHIPSDEPFVLLFLSLAEHYVHVITNPVVHKQIPGDWHKVTENFALAVRTKPLHEACGEAINQIAETLKTFFPAKI